MTLSTTLSETGTMGALTALTPVGFVLSSAAKVCGHVGTSELLESVIGTLENQEYDPINKNKLILRVARARIRDCSKRACG